MPRKPKTPQAERPKEVSERDLFQTPNYAVDILVPYLEDICNPIFQTVIWECAAGLGKIERRLRERGFEVKSTDLSYHPSTNFLEDEPDFLWDILVTNPPFSIKNRFIQRAIDLGKPFAFLVPADYSTEGIEMQRKYGLEKIIPTRRIDFITPRVLQRIHEGEVWKKSKLALLNELNRSLYVPKKDLATFRTLYPKAWQAELLRLKDYCNWSSIYAVPAPLLKKYSSSYYHSMWLTRGFELGRSETFVDLSLADKLKI